MPFSQLHQGSNPSFKAGPSPDFVAAGVTSTPELQCRNQLCCVERSSLRSIGIAGEPAEAPRAVKETDCRQSASGLTEYERSNERPAGFGVLLHQTLEGDRDLMDGIGWRQLKQSGESAIGDGQACRCHVLKARAQLFRDRVTITRGCSRLQGDGTRAPCRCALFAVRLDDQGPRPRVVAHRHPRAALVFVNTSLDQTADLTALHLCLERLRLKAKPGSNGFRSDDNRTICDRDRSCRQHGHCMSFLAEKCCNTEVLPGSKLMQICSVSSAASGSFSRPHWYRHGSLLRR